MVVVLKQDSSSLFAGLLGDSQMGRGWPKVVLMWFQDLSHVSPLPAWKNRAHSGKCGLG